ncbi:minor capsid protein [Loigolactobacillus backii]|uniref:minor capsid protein n=1 Tax=Loigolactobacillus backii TaxID=375175 RepID=UPI0022FDB077|nr:minor capsid protein [Loigolactobacillus backii]MDA5386962.1 minor capsid protein [Loigolactobacillus backii]MDA5389500.1 minor capsid protein [Loigolactobacillus backii]
MDQYWEKREKDFIKANLRSDAEFDKEIQRHYQQAVNSVNDDINRFYANYAKREGISMSEAVKRVASEDVKGFSQRAGEMVKNKDFSDNANRRLRLYNATMRINRLEELKAQIGLNLTEMSADQEKAFTDKFNKAYLNEISRQAGILGKDKLVISDKMLASVVNGSYQNAMWSDRLWANQDELKGLLDNLLTQAVIQGKGPIELARQISTQMGTKAYVAQRLARTETARIQDQAQMDSFKKYGVEKVKWVAEPSACRICASIASQNDGIYDLDEVPMIPAHPNCRCAKAAYVEAKEAKDTNADPISAIKDKMSKIDMSSASKDDIIGLGKAANSACHFDKLLGDKEQLKAAFSQFREMGGQVDKETWYPRSNRMVKQQLETAFSYYPKQWTDYLQQNNQRLFAGNTGRGFFVPDLVNANLSKYLRGAKYGDGVSIYGSGSRTTTPYHEIGHMVDHFNPDLVRIEKEFVASRTKGEDETMLNDIFPGFGYRLSETTKKDDFISPYIGKEYKDATEVLSIGLESVFEPGKGQLKSVTNSDHIYKLITDDPEYFNLIIGLILKG